METDTTTAPRRNARGKLLDAAVDVIRAQGYAGTTVDDLCGAAGVTKGAFFHHFKSKDELAVAAADHWRTTTSDLFAQAPYHQPADPLDRVLAYVDFRKDLVRGDLPDFTCLVGTMVQEAYDSHPDIRDACGAAILGHAETLGADIAAAIARYQPTAGVRPRDLALYTQAVLQGAFILAKAGNDPSVVTACLDQLRDHIERLFRPSSRKDT